LIKNLGASFCNIEPDKLTEEALSKKKKVSAPGGKKPISMTRNTLRRSPRSKGGLLTFGFWWVWQGSLSVSFLDIFMILLVAVIILGTFSSLCYKPMDSGCILVILAISVFSV
ncbi:hypothetical protein BAE44_0026376, partial [Dichanthelium oligosanthes]